MPTPTIPFYTNVKGLLGKAFNKLKDKDFSKKLTEVYHSNADKIPPKLHQIIYDTLKDTGFSANLEDIPYNFLANAKSSQLNPDNVFLMSPAQQKAALESLGYKQVDTTNGYGLVNSAVQKYKSATGRDVPMYQIGADDAQREQLILLKTDDQYTPARNYKWVTIEEYPGGGHWQTEETGPNMGDTASTPTRYYRDENGNIYTKSWDFFDHGDYSRAQYDDKIRGGYVARTLTDMSQEYGNLLDVAGNPFVKTTGYTKVITDPHGHLKNNALNDALRAIVGIDEYYHNNLDYETNQDRVLRDVMAGKYDYKKHGGIIKAQEGNIIWDSGKYLIPVVGTYYSIKDAINNPSWKNIGLAGLSAIGDAASIFGVGELAKAGVGAIKAGKTLKAMKPAIQAVEETSKVAGRAANTYNKARQATNAVSLMNDLDNPMSTVVKMAQKEDAARAAFQAATKNADDAYNYWDGLQMLYNKQRVPINRDAITAGMTGFVSTNAAQQAIKEKRGGILKAQSGTKSPYQLIMQEGPSTYTDGYGVEREEYEPKWIKTVRNIRQRLSPALNANGERKYTGSSGMLGFLVAPEWEGLEIPEVTSMHRGFQGTPRGISAVETSRFVNIPTQAAKAPKSVVKGNSTAAPKKPSKAMLQAFKERTGFDFSVAPKEMQEREIAAWEKHVADIRARYRKNR